MNSSIKSHGKTFPFVDLTKENKEFKKSTTSKIHTKECMVVKTTFCKGHHQEKAKKRRRPKSISMEGRQLPSLNELEAKVYSFQDSDVSMIFDEFLAKKVIDLPESKRPKEIN